VKLAGITANANKEPNLIVTYEFRRDLAVPHVSPRSVTVGTIH